LGHKIHRITWGQGRVVWREIDVFEVPISMLVVIGIPDVLTSGWAVDAIAGVSVFLCLDVVCPSCGMDEGIEL
jgi:hypothetical protein